MQITKEESNITFSIHNPGYDYSENDTLRFKDSRLRNTVYFKVIDKQSVDQEYEFTQDIIKYDNFNSRTIKKALGNKEYFYLKSIHISGSTQNLLQVKLFKNNIKSETDKNSVVLKEFYYHQRNNISENIPLNILVENNHEFYLVVNKIITSTDSDLGKFNTLNFSLEGTKISNIA